MISEVINDIIKSTASYDNEELMELLENLRKEVTEEENTD